MIAGVDGEKPFEAGFARPPAAAVGCVLDVLVGVEVTVEVVVLSVEVVVLSDVTLVEVIVLEAGLLVLVVEATPAGVVFGGTFDEAVETDPRARAHAESAASDRRAIGRMFSLLRIAGAC